jgi:hypothetical protein
MNLDTFLKEPVIHFSGTAITVKDAINYVRNYAGLEHKNEPDTDVMKAAEIGSMQFRLAGMPSVLYALRSVTSLTLTGCMPLYEKLKEIERLKRGEPG